jgi:hypothetical protein
MENRSRHRIAAPMLLLAPIIATCITIAIYPVIITTDVANNPTLFFLFLLFAFFFIYMGSAIILTPYFLLQRNVKNKSRILLALLISFVASFVVAGIANLHSSLGFPYGWTAPVYSTHCGYGLNSTFPGSYQCFTRQSGVAIDPIGIGLDVAVWISIVELILWGSLFLLPTRDKIGASNWLWAIVGSSYSASILIGLFSIFFPISMPPPNGFPLSPWKYLSLSICTQYPGSWCYGLQSDVLLLDFAFWVGVSLLCIIVATVTLNKIMMLANPKTTTSHLTQSEISP